MLQVIIFSIIVGLGLLAMEKRAASSSFSMMPLT